MKTQQPLPLTVHETRAAKLERLLTLANGRVLTASDYTFTPAAAIRAAAIAHGKARR